MDGLGPFDHLLYQVAPHCPKRSDDTPLHSLAEQQN